MVKSSVALFSYPCAKQPLYRARGANLSRQFIDEYMPIDKSLFFFEYGAWTISSSNIRVRHVLSEIIRADKVLIRIREIDKLSKNSQFQLMASARIIPQTHLAFY
jgi:hypothetical protein